LVLNIPEHALRATCRFEGDGMVHAARIKNGAASYCNRWVQTNRMEQEQLAQQPLYAKVTCLRLLESNFYLWLFCMWWVFLWHRVCDMLCLLLGCNAVQLGDLQGIGGLCITLLEIIKLKVNVEYQYGTSTAIMQLPLQDVQVQGS
jgi:hypothetical protein